MKNTRHRKLQLFIMLFVTGLCAVPIAAQTTAFTYQGKLTEAGNPANGTYDMQFKLFDTASVATGTQQGGTVTVSSVSVSNGSFSVELDFGANVFDGSARFLEIGVRPAGNPNPYTVLAPRQPINSAPYAIQTVNAQQLGGFPATRYIVTDSNGNVGIGTSSPATRLEVVHPISQLRFGPSTADNGGYLISTNPSQAIIAGGAKWDGANWIARDTAASLTAHQNGVIQFLTNSNLSVGSPFSPTARMHIDINGFVGIGTTLPEQQLHLHGGKILLTGSDAAFTFRDRNSGSSDDDWAWYAAGGRARLYNNSFGDVLSVTANGFVGIGTTLPEQHLQVNGKILATGNQAALTFRNRESPNANGDWALYATGGIARLYNNTNGDVLAVTTNGTVAVNVLQINGGADFAENFDVTHAATKKDKLSLAIEPGLVVSIDPADAGKLLLSARAYDRRVAGIISGAGGVKPGLMMGQAGSVADGKHPVALTGRVYCQVDASYGAIKPGDLLTSSATPGHAMKVTNYARAQGAIIGKAMTSLKRGRGLVLVLVTLQ